MRNLFFIFLATVSLCAAVPRVELSLLDMNGSSLSSVAVGIPFQVQVAVIDVDEVFSAPTLQGVQHFVRGPMSSSTQFTIMNGQRSSRRMFSYVLRADSPGIFTVGPARIEHNRATMESNQLKVEVTPMQQVAAPAGTNKPATVTVTLDKKKVFVGEPIHVTITLLHEQDARLHAPLVFEAEKAGFVLGKQSPATTRQVQVDGKLFVSIEQKMELYSYHPGWRTVPAITAQCQIPVKRQASRSFFDFDDFFGRRIELYNAYSAAVSVEVVPLPASSHTAEFIGELRNFSAQLEQAEAKVGEGVVLKLIVEGKGNEQKLSFPALDLPAGLTSYESKSALEEHGDGWKKTFEYVVQGTRQGEYRIPAQRLHYFDVARKKYETVATTPLTLSMAEGVRETVFQKKDVQPVAGQLIPEDETAMELLPLIEERSGLFDNLPAMPMRYFYYLRFLMIFLVLGIPAFLRWQRGSQKHQAIRRARSLLAGYKKRRDVTQLYQLMLNLFSQAGLVSTPVTEQAIVDYLAKAGVDQNIIAAWEQDLNRFAQASFGAHDGSNHDVAIKDQLFEAAQVWINKIEKMS